MAYDCNNPRLAWLHRVATPLLLTVAAMGLVACGEDDQTPACPRVDGEVVPCHPYLADSPWWIVRRWRSR